MKSILKSDLLLTPYDPSQKIVAAVNASIHGVGAVISHIFSEKTKKASMHAAR